MAGKQIIVRDYTKEIPGELSPDGITWYFPTVKSTNSHGKQISWRVHVKCAAAFPGEKVTAGDEPRFVKIISDYNLLDNKTTVITIDGVQMQTHGWIKVESSIGDGDIRISVPTIVSVGKNAKSTASTTPFCQALRDAYSLHNKQLRKATTNVAGGSVVRYPPMLAQVMKRANVEKILAAEQCYVQRKYNGVRVVTTAELTPEGKDQCGVIMYSRRGIPYPGFEYIKRELAPAFADYLNAGVSLYLDGEIYKHGAALQDISGAARREDNANDEAPTYQYMVYDCFDPARPELLFSERRHLLRELFDTYEFKDIVEVATWTVSTMGEIDYIFAEALREGYEGAMVRLDRAYKYSYNEHHSSVLLKIKQTLDAEYIVTGYTTGVKGKAAGALMIICKTPAGDEFPVTPAMEIPERIRLAAAMGTTVDNSTMTVFERDYKGKPLIVYYDELSKDGVPQRGRTKMEIRTWE